MAVELSNHDLAARCTVCRKSLLYPKGMHLDLWQAMVHAFTRKHKDCKPN